ncbi:glycosyltransferase family 39 protein [Chloroflexi bacterium TSY]|nr:glycosyltransferase family 39 protein [Chloroflexi bacterium TSY]
MTIPHSFRRWQRQLALLLLLAALLLPRIFALDHFVTIDEKRWLTRSANFYHALVHGPYENTFQQGHPGVMTMWSGLIGYTLTFPDYPTVAPGQFDSKDDALEAFVATQGQTPIALLASGRRVAVLINVLVLLVAFLVSIRIVGLTPALIGFLLIALDPFHVAHSRFLHTDALLSSFMLLSLVALIAYLVEGRRIAMLGLSGVAAALAWLTKTPGLFLISYVGLIILMGNGREFYRTYKEQGIAAFSQSALRLLVRPYLLWLLVAVGVYLLLWPAMWVEPVETLLKVVNISSEYAAEGHSNALFFAGEVFNGDPGLDFYPITYLWRTTPITLAGLGLAILTFMAAVVWQRNIALELRQSRSIQILFVYVLLFALFFVLFMNLGAKKFDRYLLPIYMPLDLGAGIGWAALVSWIWRWQVSMPTRIGRGIVVALVVAIVAAQGALALPTFPYYLSYYNPLMGGAAEAQKTMLVGWGEGMDEAARFILGQRNEEPIASNAATSSSAPSQNPIVSAWYSRGPFSFFYPGQSVSSQHSWTADYAVLYQNQWQREVPARQLVAHFNRQSPDHVVKLGGIDYARVYKLTDSPYADFVVDWGTSIRLVSYTLTTGTLQRGQPLRLALYLENIAPIESNLNMLVRIVNADGYELMRSDRWPFGSATSDWQIGELWIDRFKFDVPSDAPDGLYRLEIVFYEPTTLERLPITNVNHNEHLGDTLVLDYIPIDPFESAKATLLPQPVNFAQQVELSALGLMSGEGLLDRQPLATFAPGDRMQVHLVWTTLAHMATHYTGFAHLVGPDGTLAAQQDKPVLDGFVSMPLWYPGQKMLDEYQITIPDTATPGPYRLHVGLYDPATIERLTVQRGDEIIGDSFLAAEIMVE